MNIEEIDKQMEAAWASFRRHSLEAERQESIANIYLTLYNTLEGQRNAYEDDGNADGVVLDARPVIVLKRNEEY